MVGFLVSCGSSFWVIEAIGVCGFIQKARFAPIVAVVDPGTVPGQVEDINAGSRHASGHLEDAGVEPNGDVVVDATGPLHAKQILNIGNHGQGAAGVFNAHPFLQGTDADAAMGSLMILGQIVVQIGIEFVNG